MAQETDRVNQSSSEVRQTELSKLAICLVLMFLAYWLFSGLMNVYLSRVYLRSHPGLRAGDFVYAGAAFFILLEMVVVLWVHRPVSSALRNRSPIPGGTNALIPNLSAGVTCGLVGLLCSIPLLRSVKTEFFVSTLIPQSHPISSVIWNGFLFGIALPITAEMAFRGVAQRVLERHMSPLATILVAAMLFTGFWPFFGFPFAFILGLVSGILYWWRGSVLACIVANVVMTISAAAYVVLRI